MLRRLVRSFLCVEVRLRLQLCVCVCSYLFHMTLNLIHSCFKDIASHFVSSLFGFAFSLNIYFLIFYENLFHIFFNNCFLSFISSPKIHSFLAFFSYFVFTYIHTIQPIKLITIFHTFLSLFCFLSFFRFFDFYFLISLLRFYSFSFSFPIFTFPISFFIFYVLLP